MKRCITLIMLVLAFSVNISYAFNIEDLAWAKDVGAREVPKGKKQFKVTSYGGKADGVTMNTKAIQKAIDACHKAGGGIVTFEKGSYLTGSIYLKDGVNLNIPEGVTIFGSTNIVDYPEIYSRVAGVEMMWPSALININGAKKVMISGKGIIHAQGKVFWDYYWALRKEYEPKGLRWIVDYDAKRPRTLLVMKSEDVTIKEVTFQQAGFWTVQILYSTYCSVDGVIIQNNIGGHGPSTDGIDIDSSSKILVENCDIDCNDDNFCLKAGRDADGLRVNRPTEYIVIRNCISRAGGGLLTCGSETSGGIRYVLAHNLKAKGTSVGIRLKSAMNRGGTTEHIYVRDIEMEKIGTAFEATTNWNPSYSYSALPAEYAEKELPDHWRKMLEKVEPAERGIPHFKNIYLSNFKIKGARNAINVSGSKDTWMENFNFDNFDIETSNAGTVNYGLNWTFSNMQIKSSRPLNIKNSEGVEFNN